MAPYKDIYYNFVSDFGIEIANLARKQKVLIIWNSAWT